MARAGARLTVLHVVEAVEAGVARHVLDLATSVGDVRHLVAAPTRRDGGGTDHAVLASLGEAAELVAVPMTRSPATAVNALALRRVVHLLRERSVDVVHGHSAVGGALARLAAAATGRPAVHTPHGQHPHRAAQAVERALRPLSTLTIAVSAGEAGELLRSGLARPSRLVVIPNGIDPLQPPDTVQLRALAGVPPRAPLIVVVGRLVDQKDPLTAVAALRRVLEGRPDVHAVVAGEGPLLEQVRAAAAPVADRLHVLGAVAGVAAGLPAADLLLLTSRYEAGPYVLLEAMRAGLAVVATDVPGTRDAVSAEVATLVEPGDPLGTAQAVLAVLADPGRRAAAAAAGPRRVAGQFDRARMAAGHLRAYRRAAAARSRA